MNTKKTEEALKKEALKLKDGDQQQQAIGEQTHALALALEKHRKATERPVTAKIFEGIRTGPNKGPVFTPRKLPPR